MNDSDNNLSLHFETSEELIASAPLHSRDE